MAHRVPHRSAHRNTYFFRTQRGWHGTCVEASPTVFARIEAESGRTDVINAAISNKDGTVSKTELARYLKFKKELSGGGNLKASHCPKGGMNPVR